MIERRKLQKLTECAMLVALATVLSFVKLYEAPLGGAVTLFSMVPIFMCGFVYGVRAGFAASFVYALMQLIFGIGTVAYVPTALGVVGCILLDYLVPFTLLGVAGCFKHLRVNAYVKVTLGSLVALLLRFASHFVGGAWIWYQITKDGAWNDYVFRYGKWMYSLIYNAWYMLPESLLCLVAVPVTVVLMRTIWGKKLEG